MSQQSQDTDQIVKKIVDNIIQRIVDEQGSDTGVEGDRESNGEIKVEKTVSAKRTWLQYFKTKLFKSKIKPNP